MFFASIMAGDTTPAGPWRPDKTNVAISVMGSQRLDFTQAMFPEGETLLVMGVLMSGARVTVPPDVDVVVDGLNIMGGRRVDVAHDLEPRPRRLRIVALVAMGGLRVESAG